jgi:hypothetical protein
LEAETSGQKATNVGMEELLKRGIKSRCIYLLTAENLFLYLEHTDERPE